MSRRVERVGADAEEAFRMAADIAAITHGHPAGYLAAGPFAVLIALLIWGRTVPEALAARGIPSCKNVTQASKCKARLELV
ncbi:MAG: ADP-ribosylglycohydrolase family protein [Terriglobia bacterium]